MPTDNNENIKYIWENTYPGDKSKLKYGTGIKETLYSNESKYQTEAGTGNIAVEIFDTYAYGKALSINKIFQTTEKYEFIYHETICHLPMLYHNNPKKILIIGGGDGGSLREIVKYPIEKATMVEISKEVVNACKQYIPSIPENAFENPKSELIIGDGKEFIEKYENEFDVIILDLSDPEGPAKGLISEGFYKCVKKALKKDGIVSIQSQSLTFQPQLAAIMQKNIRSAFPFVQVHRVHIPTYHDGDFAFTVASATDFTQITLDKIREKFEKLTFLKDLKYLTPELFFASAVIPKHLEWIMKK